MTDYDGLAAYYDAEWKSLTNDIPFLLNEAKKFGAPILELACGTGRITLPIAKDGHEVYGIDNSEKMLLILDNKLKKENPDVANLLHFSNQNMCNFKFDTKFKMILIPFNSILLLTDRNDMDACLKNCYDHLEDDGVFIVDIFSPSFELCAIKVPKMQFIQHFHIPDTKKVVIQWEYAKRDMAKQFINIDFLYEEYDEHGNISQNTRSIDMSIIFRYEMQYMLEKNGFRLLEFFGNYDRSEFTKDSPQMIYICEKSR